MTDDPLLTEPVPATAVRADAQRNATRIVEAAARLLGDDPHVGMAEVAAAAGLGRATVYRHFATREALMSAIQRRAVEQAEGALRASRLEEGSATDALRRVVAALMDVGERYPFPQLFVQPGVDLSDAAREHRRRILREPLVALIRRGQAAGELSPAALPEWGAQAVGALALAGARAVREGTVARADAPGLVLGTLLRGLAG